MQSADSSTHASQCRKHPGGAVNYNCCCHTQLLPPGAQKLTTPIAAHYPHARRARRKKRSNSQHTHRSLGRREQAPPALDEPGVGAYYSKRSSRAGCAACSAPGVAALYRTQKNKKQVLARYSPHQSPPAHVAGHHLPCRRACTHSCSRPHAACRLAAALCTASAAWAHACCARCAATSRHSAAAGPTPAAACCARCARSCTHGQGEVLLQHAHQHPLLAAAL